MRAKICKDIDVEMLDRAIAHYKENVDYEVCETDVYIIMSESTRYQLHYIVTDDKVCVYKGNKILIDNSIPYGQVEIR